MKFAIPDFKFSDFKFSALLSLNVKGFILLFLVIFAPDAIKALYTKKLRGNSLPQHDFYR